MDLRRESTIATLQSQHNFLMAFSILSLYSQVSVAISPHQRSFSQMETTTENHDWTQMQKISELWGSHPQEINLQQHCSCIYCSGITAEEGAERALGSLL